MLALAAYAGFFTALVTRPMYGGILKDKVNGVPEVHFRLLKKQYQIDLNVLLFTPLFATSTIAAILVFVH